MTSIPVKEIGSMMGRTTTPGVGKANSQTGAASFEEVWSQQTEKNDLTDVKYEAEDTKELRKEDDNIVRDSLKAKDTRDNTVKENQPAESDQSRGFDDMNSKEWEHAMEVLGTAAVNMMQEIADTFDMTMEEVQELMNELGMEPLDVLQQGPLSDLLLAAGGETDSAALLTNEGLYQNYQSIMEQLNVVLEQSSETLQIDVEQFLTVANTVETSIETSTETEGLSIEATPEETTVTAEVAEDAEATITKTTSDADDALVNVEGTKQNVTVEQSENTQMQNQSNNGEQADNNAATAREVTDDKGQNGNVLLQNVKAEQFEPQLQQLTQTASVWDGDTVDIMRQIMDYMRIQIKPDMSNLEMQLHPESLGTLQIRVAAKDGAVTAQFVTQNETVKAALESQMIQLKESFAEQGVKVDAIEVTVQTHQFEQNLEQGRGRQQEETTGRRNGTRRLRLDGIFSAEEMADMDGEEQLVVEMMEANGNTVDFTA